MLVVGYVAAVVLVGGDGNERKTGALKDVGQQLCRSPFAEEVVPARSGLLIEGRLARSVGAHRHNLKGSVWCWTRRCPGGEKRDEAGVKRTDPVLCLKRIDRSRMVGMSISRTPTGGGLNATKRGAAP